MRETVFFRTKQEEFFILENMDKTAKNLVNICSMAGKLILLVIMDV